MLYVWPLLILSAILEVGGDAAIRSGLRGGGWPYIVFGAIVLGGYGCLVNLVRWDFSRLLGVYVAAFALISVLAGLIVFHESVSFPRWLGLGLIMLGGIVIQFSR